MPDLAIERLKRELTDKYVIVTGGRPDLARFAGVVGQVKTVNFSGRALVEFTGYLNNPAWFDIEPECLRVVDAPPPPDTLAKKAPRPASKVPAKAAGASAADVLAAVRGGGKAAPKPDAAGRTPAPAAPVAKAEASKKSDATPKGDKKAPDKKTSPAVGQSTADILAAARGKKTPDPPATEVAKVEGTQAEGKRTSPSVGLSTADVLAAARGKKPAPTADSSPSDPSAAAPTPPASQPKAPRPSGMTTEEILAAARGAKQPAHEKAKPSAIDSLDETAKGPEPRRHLTAADIRDIGLGKLSIRREPVVATTPREKKVRPESTETQVDALPKKLDHTKLTAADILKMGLRK
ncbi:hypothetical protein [Botrimarina mediterranea]|uniref:Uncharacterized protein n=1 Tax=Botrimarina mediterranea TaxID=2528022 RepID=A0A518K2N9_9BACT|nr:hypothetical protein [Botrimarina mediterranea]QDV72064.1 hypothetical protein Spa11_02340 [Botrimarina mediterranea]QDV76605.1 hypothetical protein K2D_01840 [Planctomycetes bacterium K2D]